MLGALPWLVSYFICLRFIKSRLPTSVYFIFWVICPFYPLSLSSENFVLCINIYLTMEWFILHRKVLTYKSNSMTDRANHMMHKSVQYHFALSKWILPCGKKYCLAKTIKQHCLALLDLIIPHVTIIFKQLMVVTFYLFIYLFI